MPTTNRTSSTAATGGGTDAGARRFEEYRDTFRSDWETRYGRQRPWEEHEPGYRYGWEAGQESRYQGKQFSDVESDLQSGWGDYAGRSARDTGDTPTGRSGTGSKDYPGKHEAHSVGAHDTVGGKLNHAWENLKDTVREGFDRARSDR